MILALDVGSSSVRALLFERQKKHLRPVPGAVAQHSCTFDHDVSGQATVKPRQLKQLLEACVDEVLQYAGSATIDAVSMATFAGNWLAVDSHNQPQSDVVTYADTRNRATLAHLRETLDSNAIQARTGAALRAAYYPAQIFHAMQNGLSVTRIRDIATWCYESWFGREVPVSYSLASWSGLLNRRHLTWDDALLNALNLSSDALPPLADYTAAAQGLSPEYAERWTLLQNVPFFLAVADGAAAQVGSGAAADQTAALTIGTTAAMRYVSRDMPDVPAGGWSYRIDAAHHVTGGALSEGGNLFAWARSHLGIDPDYLNQALREHKPGSHGLTVIPTFNGERSPGWQAESGTLHGVRLTTTPDDMALALLESVALRLAHMANLLDLPANTRIMASGGALHASEAWAQVIADALNRPLHLLDDSEVTAHGTAFLAEAALRNLSLSALQTDVQTVLQPRPGKARMLQQLLDEQNRLYQRLYS
jgi:gluconokinase